MKIIFMGTPDFAVPSLESLYRNGFDIPLVVTQQDKPKGRGKKLTYTPVKLKAQELSIKVYQPKNVNSPESIKLIKEISPDAIVVVAYGQILKKEILNYPKYGCINVHASLLPKYRGAAPINWAIINGEKKTGVTTMIMDEGLDTGDMLISEETEIKDEETAGELHDRLKHIGAKLIVNTLNKIENEGLVGISQNDEEATYAPMLDKSLGLIDWNKSGEEIKNLVRGTVPWPSTYFVYDEKKVKVHKVRVIPKFKKGDPGEVIKVDADGIYVNTSKDCIVIEEIQFPGKKRLKVSEFLKGNDFKSGINLMGV